MSEDSGCKSAGVGELSGVCTAQFTHTHPFSPQVPLLRDSSFPLDHLCCNIFSVFLCLSLFLSISVCLSLFLDPPLPIEKSQGRTLIGPTDCPEPICCDRMWALTEWPMRGRHECRTAYCRPKPSPITLKQVGPHFPTHPEPQVEKGNSSWAE